MADKRDLGLKVSNAIRLNEFAHKLADEFAARPTLAEDEFFGQFWTNDPNSFDWMRRSNAKRLAEIILAKAVREGVLELWVRLADGEASVDHYSIPLFVARDAAAGAYVPYAHNDHALHGRPLWVKNTDWQMFYTAIMRERYPDEFPNPAAEVSASPATEQIGSPLPLSQSDLRRWWDRLDGNGKAKPQNDLLAMCRAAFPGRSISRQRIRDLTGPRKRGKKPIR